MKKSIELKWWMGAVLASIFAAHCASAGRHSPATAYESSQTKIAGVMKYSTVSPSNQLDQKLIYTASLTLDVEKDLFEKTLEGIANRAKEKKGYVVSLSTQSITIKVPTTIFKESMAELKKLGEVASENVQVQDITEEFQDVEIRLANAEKLQKRLTQLLAKAATVEDTIKVETELSRVTEKIEALKGKMRLYSNQVDFSTISIYLQEPVKLGPLGWVSYILYRGIKWLFVWN